jgi:hypothetical protein
MKAIARKALYDVCQSKMRRLIDDIMWVEGKARMAYPEYVKFNISEPSADNYITFLDTEVSIDMHDIRMHYKEFHRPFTDWHSNVPRAFIVNTITTECMRARRNVSRKEHYDTARTYLRMRAMEVNIPEGIVDDRMGKVPWRDSDVIEYHTNKPSNTQAIRMYDQSEGQLRRWQSRQCKTRQMLEKGKVVVIQRVFTKCDTNIANLLTCRFACHEDTISRAISAGVKPEIAEDFARRLEARTFVRARKPTTSMKAIARKALKAAIASRREEEYLDGQGAQWRHREEVMTGVEGMMLRTRIGTAQLWTS